MGRTDTSLGLLQKQVNHAKSIVEKKGTQEAKKCFPL